MNTHWKHLYSHFIHALLEIYVHLDIFAYSDETTKKISLPSGTKVCLIVKTVHKDLQEVCQLLKRIRSQIICWEF